MRKRKIEEMVIIPLPDGEEIYITKKELGKIGQEGAIKKYAAQFFRKNI